MKRIAVAAMLIIVVLTEGIGVPTALANAGPPTRVEDGDASFLLPVKHDCIEVVSEDLVYDIEVTDESAVQASIQATYEIRNTAQERVSTLVAFVANNPTAEVQVVLDGSPVQLLESMAMPWNVTGEDFYVGDLLKREWSNLGSWTEYGVWEPTFQEILRFASTGERTGDTNTGYDLTLSLFGLVLEAGAMSRLSVAYTEEAAVITERQGYLHGYGNPKAEFYYFLEPAKYWKGFSDLTITVKLPPGIGFEASLDGFAREANSYVARFDDLPDKNLRILLDLETSSIFETGIRAGLWFAGALVVVLGIRMVRKRSHM